MVEVRRLYHLISEDEEYRSASTREMEKELDNFIETSGWSEKERETFSDILYDGSYIGQEYGFDQGFRYAVKLLLGSLIDV